MAAACLARQRPNRNEAVRLVPDPSVAEVRAGVRLSWHSARRQLGPKPHRPPGPTQATNVAYTRARSVDQQRTNAFRAVHRDGVSASLDQGSQTGGLATMYGPNAAEMLEPP